MLENGISDICFHIQMCRIFVLPSVWTSPFSLIIPATLSPSLFMGVILQNDRCHWSCHWEGWLQEKWGGGDEKYACHCEWPDCLTPFTAKAALQAPPLPSQPAVNSFYQKNEGLTLFFWWFTIMGTFTPRAILWSEHWGNNQKIELSCGFGIDTDMPMSQLPI